jgi:hypothetical protein
MAYLYFHTVKDGLAIMYMAIGVSWEGGNAPLPPFLYLRIVFF